jgi:seryl-tRNA synthetase
MHDIKFIRENPAIFDAAMQRRGIGAMAAKLIKMDEEIRNNQTQLQVIQSRRNELAKAIGMAKSKGEDAAALMQEGEDIKQKTPMLEQEIEKLQTALMRELEVIPNILSDEVPVGVDDNDSKELRTWGEIRKFDFKPLEHFDLGEKLGLMDFEQTAKLSGARFVTLKAGLAKLERALINFFLDNHTNEFGYTEIVHPTLVKTETVYGVGQLPKFAEDLFKTTNDYWLTSTSEVFLTNLVADQIIPEEQLPLRFTAYSSCYRSEAGSAGRDTRGMIRQHQFSKVEMVSITNEKDSKEEHERMVGIAENLLQKLGLPYRVVMLATGDTGFCSNKTYDIEVWLPGQDRYREISSCSNCTDFQARRMKARFKRLSDKKNYFVHTLNGSGLPIGRTIIAIMENYQNADGSITVPEKLVPYMGGLKRIER